MLQTRNITIGTGSLRLPVLIDDAVRNEIFEWLRQNKVGPLETGWRFHHILNDNDIQHISRHIYYAAKRPGDSSRAGYLCLYPPLKSVLYVEGTVDRRPSQNGKKPQGPRIFVIRMRVDPRLWESAGAIFIATLSALDRVILVEDLIMYKGAAFFREKRFSERWSLLESSLREEMFLDENLEAGLRISSREVVSLNDVSDFGTWDIIPEVPGRSRLLWVSANAQKISAPKQKQEVPVIPPPAPALEVINIPVGGQTEAIARKGAFPDQFFLTSRTGADLGMAVIQNLGLSKQLRILTKEEPSCRVQIRPSELSDGSYEITAILG